MDVYFEINTYCMFIDPAGHSFIVVCTASRFSIFGEIVEDVFLIWLCLIFLSSQGHRLD